VEIQLVIAAIRKRRERVNNMRELALELGVSRMTLYNAMNGVGQPSYKLLSALGLLKSVVRAK
jgi:DNA-binding phage protein